MDMQTDALQSSAPKKTKVAPRPALAATRLLTQLVRRVIESFRAPPPSQSPLRLEALEPRILLSGDPMGARVDASLDVAGETDRYSFTLTDDLRIAFDSEEFDRARVIDAGLRNRAGFALGSERHHPPDQYSIDPHRSPPVQMPTVS